MRFEGSLPSTPDVTGLSEAHRNMFIILPKLVGGGHHFPFRDPLLQVIHVPLQLAETEVLLQFGPALLSEVLQAGIELVHLALPKIDPLAASQGKGKEALFMNEVNTQVAFLQSQPNERFLRF